MQQIRQLIQKLEKLNGISKFSIKLGTILMTCTYILAIAAHLSASYVADYYGAMSIYRGCLEAAPAFLVVGICAALLGDLMLSQNSSGREPPDQD